MSPSFASLKASALGLAVSFALGTAAVAAVPIPITKPAPPPPSDLLSEADGHALWDGLDAREKGKWMEVRQFARQISDPTAKAILNWLRFQKEGTGSTVAEVVAFQEQHPHWPRQDRLSRRAEEALTDYPMRDADVIAWFATRDPLTGEGKVRLGEALLNNGQRVEGATWIQRAWVEHQFSRSRESEILKKYGSHLPPQAHEDRLNRLIWEQRFSDGRRMLQLVDAEARALADARLKLASRSRGAESAVTRVPASLRTDAGLLFDHARYLRRRGQEQTAIPLLLTPPTATHSIARPDRAWTERKILARKALTEGHYQEAYGLATGHGHERGVAFAEGEFLAGWIALQYLNDANRAFVHFQTLEAGVTTPISKSRGAYWMGRAAEARGRADEARGYYRRASSYPTTFYGQLATSRLSSGTALLQLPAAPSPTAAQSGALAASDMVRAFELMNEAGEDSLARSFVIELAKTLPDATALAALADLMVERDLPNLSVRVAKIAAGRGISLPERSYPTAVLPAFTQVGKPVEPALVYGLSRQESEFNPRAISHAGARGLMQLMPRTARAVARQIGVPYRRARLTDDPSYNATLGSAHLSDLLDDFAGSYIMTIAAYNAGAHRVSQWVERYGDPRDPAVDPIDWMENIPFTETRNYVQRVIENVQVYRARLRGQAVDLKIEQDIARYDGTAPIIQTTPKPRTQLTPLAIPAATPPAIAVPAAPTVAALPPTRRDIPAPNPARQPAAPQTSPQPVSQPAVAPAPEPVPAAATPAAPINIPAATLDAPADVTLSEGAMMPVVEENDPSYRPPEITPPAPILETTPQPTLVAPAPAAPTLIPPPAAKPPRPRAPAPQPLSRSPAPLTQRTPPRRGGGPPRPRISHPPNKTWGAGTPP
ncbi:MAG: lytic transglycosylase domain-containing protein, partial [Rhodobiaceae bacterium]|nr:lytic transglycosylase domain-containing protein [Rhodobiaceae bacterium]